MVISSLIMFYHHEAPAKIVAEAEGKSQENKALQHSRTSKQKMPQLDHKGMWVA